MVHLSRSIRGLSGFGVESEQTLAGAPPLGQYSTTPIFNTKAVARDTDVPADTFRAWERRYGIPRPQRTPGGHRLYSERDIAVIRWLRDRTAEGMNISQAVMLLNSSLANLPDELPEPAPTYEPRALERLNDDLLNALTSFDATHAERLIGEAFAMYPFEDVLLLLILPSMIEIGERWHHGEINVAVEHFATQFVRRKLSSMLNTFERDPGRGNIIIACAPDELHDLGAMFAALFLVRRGWHVIYLGPQVPLFDLQEAVRTLKPDLVCLSASMPETALQVAEVAIALQHSAPNVLIGYGGRVFNQDDSLRASIPGVFLGKDARELTDAVANLLSRNSTSTVDF